MVMPGETVDTGAPLPYEGAQPEVITSGGGRYFIGYLDEDGTPYTRESEYYRTYELAEEALDAGTWSRGLVPRSWSQRRPKPSKSVKLEPATITSGVGKNARLDTEATLQDLENMRADWALLYHPDDRWTFDEIEWVKEQRAEGRSWKDCAVAMDRCRAAANKPSQVATSVRVAVDTFDRFGRLAGIKPETFVSFEEWRNTWVSR
jgi:hypothetical protein